VTTKGLTRHDERGEWIRELPEVIARLSELGQPIIVEHTPPLPEHTQRLYASLGVLVRFRSKP
jgi:hypothetical protein